MSVTSVQPSSANSSAISMGRIGTAVSVGTGVSVGVSVSVGRGVSVGSGIAASSGSVAVGGMAGSGVADDAGFSLFICVFPRLSAS